MRDGVSQHAEDPSVPSLPSIESGVRSMFMSPCPYPCPVLFCFPSADVRPTSAPVTAKKVTPKNLRVWLRCPSDLLSQPPWDW